MSAGLPARNALIRIKVRAIFEVDGGVEAAMGRRSVQTACASILDTAQELLDFGVLNEGALNLVSLRRCAHSLGCPDWQECRCRIDDAWEHRAALPCQRMRPARDR